MILHRSILYHVIFKSAYKSNDNLILINLLIK